MFFPISSGVNAAWKTIYSPSNRDADDFTCYSESDQNLIIFSATTMSKTCESVKRFASQQNCRLQKQHIQLVVKLKLHSLKRREKKERPESKHCGV